MTQTTPAGWYHGAGDPPGTKRYWDGNAWVGEPQVDSGNLPGPTTASMSPTSDQLVRSDRIASIPRRLFGRLIDAILWTLPPLIVLAAQVDWDAFGTAFDALIDASEAGSTSAQQAAAQEAFQDDVTTIVEDATSGSRVLSLIVTLVLWSIEAALVKITGWTPGKLLMGTRIVDEVSSHNLTWAKALARTGIRGIGLLGAISVAVGQILGLVVLLIGLASFVMILAQDQRKTVMDMVAGSNVVSKKWLANNPPSAATSTPPTSV